MTFTYECEKKFTDRKHGETLVVSQNSLERLETETLTTLYIQYYTAKLIFAFDLKFFLTDLRPLILLTYYSNITIVAYRSAPALLKNYLFSISQSGTEENFVFIQMYPYTTVIYVVTHMYIVHTRGGCIAPHIIKLFKHKLLLLLLYHIECYGFNRWRVPESAWVPKGIDKNRVSERVGQ